MRFELEGAKRIEHVTERNLRYRLGRKRGGDTRFAILERSDGSYVQMLGGGVACCLEWRDSKAKRHYRAYVDPPKVPWREPSLLGQMHMRPEEFLFIEQVVEAFAAFLNDIAFPADIRWRDVTAELTQCVETR